MTSGTDPDRFDLVVITAEPVGSVMAGPAIRATELAAAVATAGHQVLVVSLAAAENLSSGVRTRAIRGDDLRSVVESAGCVLVQGDVLGLEPWLVSSGTPIVVDAYDPFHLEQLEQTRTADPQRRAVVVRDCVRSLNLQLRRADLVLAASPRQRDLWLGHLSALGRINPVTYDEAADLGALLRVVPFGLDDRPPADQGTDVIRAEFPAVGPDALVALWAGGLYDWFDPALVVRAVAEVRRAGIDLHLVLLGAGHPVLGSAPGPAAVAAIEAADAAGLLGTAVHRVDRWIPFQDRAQWLAAADVGVVAHRRGVETEFAFRTRLLDHLWAGLPTVATAGDTLADGIAGHGAGLATPIGDHHAFAGALKQVLDPVTTARMRDNAEEYGRRFRWSVVVEPLLDFVRAPRRAPDLVLDPNRRALLGLESNDPGPVARIRATLAEGGPALIVDRISRRLRRIVGRT